jgi:hypothetical protein
MSTTKETTTKVTTGKVRFSYVHVFKAVAAKEGQDEKFSVSIIIPKKDKAQIKKLQDAIDAAKAAGKDKTFGGKIPTVNFKLPLRDGDEERPEDPAYKDSMFISASTKTKPGIVDEKMQEIIDPTKFYSGCYGRASLNAFPFNKAGSKGIAFGLNNLQFLEDGEPLSGRTTAEEDFKEDEL